jgi:hypothetical protein
MEFVPLSLVGRRVGVMLQAGCQVSRVSWRPEFCNGVSGATRFESADATGGHFSVRFNTWLAGCTRLRCLAAGLQASRACLPRPAKPPTCLRRYHLLGLRQRVALQPGAQLGYQGDQLRHDHGWVAAETGAMRRWGRRAEAPHRVKVKCCGVVEGANQLANQAVIDVGVLMFAHSHYSTHLLGFSLRARHVALRHEFLRAIAPP